MRGIWRRRSGVRRTWATHARSRVLSHRGGWMRAARFASPIFWRAASAAGAFAPRAASRSRLDHAGECSPVSVQIAGSDPAMLAEAARYNVERGAEIIDINMGCPAKKVCNVAAGSALLENEALVARIVEAVVAAVDVPVTVKIRTGPSPERRNAARIARIVEACGAQMISIHGRPRA